MSQSLFSWIHLSYVDPTDTEGLEVIAVSILIFLDSSFLWKDNMVIINALAMKSQSLFSWIHLSYKEFEMLKEMICKESQSLFSWIHLSYEWSNVFKNRCWSNCLNPYFPGFIFLICRRLVGNHKGPGFVSILIFLDSSFLYIKSGWLFQNKMLCLNPYFPGFIFLINEKK